MVSLPPTPTPNEGGSARGATTYSAAPAPERGRQTSMPKLSIVSLDGVRAEMGECVRCKLHKGRHNIVFGVGDPKARLMFVGEAPGEDEDLKGEPFVGKAGQLLTKMIEAMGLRRQDVYICNTVKCRPPNNRNPEPDELAACEPFLKGQLAAVKPEVIVTLGKFAAQAAAFVAYAELSGSVDPGSGDFLIEAIKDAQDRGAEALVVRLDTPGGLLSTTRDIVQAELSAKVPIVFWVGPPGARAGSAGVFLTLAAHVAAMAPSSNIGAAPPVGISPPDDKKS